MKPKCLRPKRPFLEKEMQHNMKLKIFALALSIGRVIACEVPLPFNTAAWKKKVGTVVGPLLRSSYPDRRQITIHLDGEKPFHSAELKGEMRHWNLKALPNWAAHSPDLNPAENMWPALTKQLKLVEAKTDGFLGSKKKLLRAARRYPSSEKLVHSLAVRMEECCQRSGAILRT